MEAIHSFIGGFTDSKAGSYSIGRAVRNRLKKNEQPEPAKLDDNADMTNNAEIVKNDNVNINVDNDVNKEADDLGKYYDNLTNEMENLINVSEGIFKKGNNLVNKVQPFLGTTDTMTVNKESVGFDLTISAKLDKKYFEELQEAIETIKHNKFTENQEIGLKDLLQVVMDNKISVEDSKTIEVDSSSNNVEIKVKLNSIVYCLELLGPGVNIYKNRTMVAYLQYLK